jgi:hypothetical protein
MQLFELANGQIISLDQIVRATMNSPIQGQLTLDMSNGTYETLKDKDAGTVFAILRQHLVIGAP